MTRPACRSRSGAITANHNTSALTRKQTLSLPPIINAHSSHGHSLAAMDNSSSRAAPINHSPRPESTSDRLFVVDIGAVAGDLQLAATGSTPRPLRRLARRAPADNNNNNNNSQQQRQFDSGSSSLMMGAPKLIQWSKEAVQYYEGSTLVLSCSLSYSGANQAAPLKFSWFKSGKLLYAAATGSSSSSGSRADQQQRLSIESLADYSFLRLADLRPSDSGAYTCLVSNALNQEDRTTTQVLVNGEFSFCSFVAILGALAKMRLFGAVLSL